MRNVVGLLVFVSLWGGIPRGLAAQDSSRIYVGTYTGEGPDESQGIYVLDFDPQTGQLSPPRLAATATNPSFLAIDSQNDRLLSISEVRSGTGRSGASLISWKIEEDGGLTEVGHAPTSGDGPCFVDFDSINSRAGVANYGGGSVALFHLDESGMPKQTCFVKHQGKSINEQRQGEPHAHSFQFADQGKRALAADLGTDELIVYDVLDDGTIKRNEALTMKMTPGHGPRHFAFSPDRKLVAVIQELSSVISLYAYQDGVLTFINELSTLPSGFTEPNSTAEVQFHPTGKFIYGSNRGHDSLVTLALNAETGTWESVGQTSSGGKTPRNFRVSPDGRWLIAANQSTNNLVVFEIGADGIPKPTKNSAIVPKPVCIKFAQ